MSIRTQCPHCSMAFKVQEQHIGQTAKCKKCGKTFVIEESPSPAAAPAAAQPAVAAQPTSAATPPPPPPPPPPPAAAPAPAVAPAFVGQPPANAAAVAPAAANPSGLAVTVPGMMITAPAGSKPALEAALHNWAKTRNFRFRTKPDGSTTFTRGFGFITAMKKFRVVFMADDQQVQMQIAPHLCNMGCASSMEAKFIGGIPAATGRKDRDVLVQMLYQAAPGMQVTQMPCRVKGLPMWVFMIIMIAIAVFFGIIANV